MSLDLDQKDELFNKIKDKGRKLILYLRSKYPNINFDKIAHYFDFDYQMFYNECSIYKLFISSDTDYIKLMQQYGLLEDINLLDGPDSAKINTILKMLFMIL